MRNGCMSSVAILIALFLGLLMWMDSARADPATEDNQPPATQPADAHQVNDAPATSQPADTVQAVVDLYEQSHLSLKASRFNDYPSDAPPPNGIISGQVIDEQGNAVSDHARLDLHMDRPFSDSQSVAVKDGQFSAEIMSGPVWIKATADGWATSIVGPFQLSADKPIDDVKIVMSRGIAAYVHLKDQFGKPISGADIYLSNTNGSSSGKTDAQGTAIVDHLLPGVYSLSATANAYYRQERFVQVTVGSEATLVMAHVPPIAGTVVDGVTGKPIANAAVYECTHGGDYRQYIYLLTSPVGTVAHTDAQGHFSFYGAGSAQTTVLVNTEDHRSLAIQFNEGESPVFKMPEPLYVKGHFTGDLSKLETLIGSRKGFRWHNNWTVINSNEPDWAIGGPSIDYIVEPVDGRADFRLPIIFPGKIKIDFRDRDFIELDVTKPLTDLEINLDEAGPKVVPAKPDPAPAGPSGAFQPEKTSQFAWDAISPGHLLSLGLAGPVQFDEAPEDRKVEIQFTPPPGCAKVQGYVKVEFNRGGSVDLEIKDNQLNFRAPVGEFIRCDFDKLPGVLAKKISFPVEAGKQPLLQKVSLTAAGAILCTVVDENGDPFKLDPNCFPKIARFDLQDDAITNHNAFERSYPLPTGNQYLLSPLPLNHPLMVYVNQERLTPMLAVAEVTLTPGQPVQKVTLVAKRPAHPVSIHMIGPDGEPARGVDFQVRFYLADSNLFLASARTDGNGDYLIDAFDMTAADRWYLDVKGRPGWGGALFDIPADQSEITINLAESLMIKGRMISIDGRPVIGVRIVVTSLKPDAMGHRFGSERAITDEQGNFRITGLAAGQYYLSSTDWLQPKPINGGKKPSEWPTVTAGQADPVIIEVLVDEQGRGEFRLGEAPARQ